MTKLEKAVRAVLAVHDKRQIVEYMDEMDALREALAEQPAQPCGYPYCGCNSKAWCKLDRMAENAKELGLDYEPAQQEPVAWRELCRRLYMELYWCDRQMMETLDQDGEPMWTQGKEVRDVLADAKVALETSPQPAQQQCWKCGDMDAAFQAKCTVPACGMKEHAAQCKGAA